TLLVVASGYKFLRHEVHAVVQAAHHANVRGAKVAEYIEGRMVLRAQDNRAVARGAVAQVDSVGFLAHLLFEFAVLRDRRPRRRGDLQEGEIPAPDGLEVEQPFHGAEPLEDSFRVVEPVNADPDAHIMADPELIAHLPARFANGGLPLEPARRPFD